MAAAYGQLRRRRRRHQGPAESLADQGCVASLVTNGRGERPEVNLSAQPRKAAVRRLPDSAGSYDQAACCEARGRSRSPEANDRSKEPSSASVTSISTRPPISRVARPAGRLSSRQPGSASPSPVATSRALAFWAGAPAVSWSRYSARALRNDRDRPNSIAMRAPTWTRPPGFKAQAAVQSRANAAAMRVSQPWGPGIVPWLGQVQACASAEGLWLVTIVGASHTRSSFLRSSIVDRAPSAHSKGRSSCPAPRKVPACPSTRLWGKTSILPAFANGMTSLELNGRFAPDA
jgi:hypothetical protein